MFERLHRQLCVKQAKSRVVNQTYATFWLTNARVQINTKPFSDL